MTQQLYNARIDYLFAQIKPALSSALLGMTVATVLFWQQTGSAFFFVWFGSMLALVSARYFLYQRYIATPDKDCHRWLIMYRCLAYSHGLLWSILTLASLRYGGASVLSLALIILAGVTATAIATTAADLKTFYFFCCVTLLPVCSYLLLRPEPTLIWFGVMTGSFLLIMLQVGRTYNHSFCDALNVRFENEALVKTLEQEKQELAHEKERAEQLAAQLYELSSKDSLTGLANRRAFDAALAKHLSHEQTGSLILCDIDAFKNYNDLYGHPQGDICLKAVAKAFSEVVTRPGDTVARYGGEEFGIILSETDVVGAKVVAGKLQAAVKQLALVHEASPVAAIVTVSFGVASAERGQAVSAKSLIDQADKALYQAKAQGRDQVVVAEPATALEALV